MKKNTVVIETAMNTVETAVNHEIAAGMRLVLSDKLVALNKKLADAPDGTPAELVLSPVKIAAIREEIADTEKAIADFSAMVESTEEVFSEVVAKMTENNERENVLTFIRLLAGIEQKKVMKYALPATEDLTVMVRALDTIHTSGKYSAVGAMTMTKEAKQAFKDAKEALAWLVFERFSLNETEYTKKLSVRLNSTDIGTLHECYVTGIKNEFDKNGNFVGRKVQTRVKAANKKNMFTRFDGLKTVICDIMVEKVCK